MRKKYLILCIVILALSFVLFHSFFVSFQPVKVEYVDIQKILEKDSLSQEDYRIIFLQTGLGRVSVDDLKRNKPNYIDVILNFQEQIHTELICKREYIFFPTTIAETLFDEKGERIYLKLPPLKDGDILISKSTKTLIYRHGHAGLILKGEEEQVLESMMIGTKSDVYNIDAWKNFATLMVLRPKNKTDAVEKSLSFAEKNLIGVPYNLLAGLGKKNYSNNQEVRSTHCSHLVWQAYAAGGIEIDNDGGILVTPHDIVASKELDLVFSYGFGEEPSW